MAELLARAVSDEMLAVDITLSHEATHQSLITDHFPSPASDQ
jgi:hypothetical protein